MRREKYNLLRSRRETGIMQLLPVLSARAKSQSQILEVGKRTPHLGARSHCKGPGYGARALAIIAATLVNHLSHSHYSIKSLKSPCGERVINPIFQMKKLRLGEFRLFIPLFLSSRLGIPGCWALMALGRDCDPALHKGSQRHLNSPRNMMLRASEFIRRALGRDLKSTWASRASYMTLGNTLDLSEPWFSHVCGEQL